MVWSLLAETIVERAEEGEEAPTGVVVPELSSSKTSGSMEVECRGQ